jgi:hypothetical protein
MITILGNIRINSLSRLEHFKNSFFSFKELSDDWVINIRGTFRDEAISFLRSELNNKLNLFTLLNDNRGWITNALEMLNVAKYQYILVWNEDHMNISTTDHIISVIKEMRTGKEKVFVFPKKIKECGGDGSRGVERVG